MHLNAVTIILLFVWLIQIISLVANLNAWSHYRRDYRYAPEGIPVDVSDQHLPLPKAARPLAGALEMLGFERLGEIEARGPNDDEHLPIWAYRLPGKPIHAELASSRTQSMAILVTVWGSTAAIETSYPTGLRVVDPGYRSTPVEDSVEAAYREHQEQVEAFRQRYGQPDVIATMPEFLAYSETYNRHFIRRKLDRLRMRLLAPLLTSLYGALVVGGGLAAMVLLQPPVGVLLPIITGLLLPAIAFDLILWAFFRQ